MDDDLELSVFRINGGDKDGAEILFNYNGTRISVSVFPRRDSSHQRPSTEEHLIDLLNRAISPDSNDDDYENITDDVITIILDAGKTSFDRLVSSSAIGSYTSNLHSILYPKTYTFKLSTASSRLTVTQIPPEEAYTNPVRKFHYTDEHVIAIDDSLPQYSSNTIVVEEIFVVGSSNTVCQVSVDGKVMLCKASGGGLTNLSLERELDKLQKIRTAGPTVPVPQLLGYVRHTEAGRIIGLLREWVPGCSLRELNMTTVAKDRRLSWASQIRDAVDRLHEMGIVWGDAKAANVIISERDEAWLIDLAGGWTDGWVDEELADTVEGDEQGVGQIMKFIGGACVE